MDTGGDDSGLPGAILRPGSSTSGPSAGLSATDTSPGDLTGLPCVTGYCHLEGPRIPDREAYGAGLVNVSRP